VADFEPDEEVEVAVVRGTAAPVGGLRPSSCHSGDVLYELDDLLIGDDDASISAEARWEQAKAVAAALNALGERCEGTCRCGEPGGATVLRGEDGTLTVERADPVIRVTQELLEAVDRSVWDGDTLTLDTAGEYRYRYLRPDPHQPGSHIFGRIKEAGHG
jgi:hypothetical protein